MKRWSKLQSKLYDIISDKIDFSIHVEKYPCNSNDSHYDKNRVLPRYFITINNEIIFDYPKNFPNSTTYFISGNKMSKISNIIENYINTPKEKIMTIPPDEFGLTNILRVCDKRVGYRRLKKIYDNTNNETIKKIITLRNPNIKEIDKDDMELSNY